MKQFVALFMILICAAVEANGQSFLYRLQKQIKDKGTIIVHQDAAIDELVNGNSAKATSPMPQQEKQQSKNNDTKGSVVIGNKSTNVQTEQHQYPLEAKKNNDDDHKAEQQREKREADNDNQMEIPTVDLRKKVMSKSYKVNGYRVQAYAGGNTRKDRQKAEKIGNDIKMNFPNEPIYVHFYSPRWICRVGNYRTYEEAFRMLSAIKKMGYKQASIVKGKISIQY